MKLKLSKFTSFLKNCSQYKKQIWHIVRNAALIKIYNSHLKLFYTSISLLLLPTDKSLCSVGNVTAVVL